MNRDTFFSEEVYSLGDDRFVIVEHFDGVLTEIEARYESDGTIEVLDIRHTTIWDVEDDY